jgi:diguanylate cyclase (GGDEF)-like protein
MPADIIGNGNMRAKRSAKMLVATAILTVAGFTAICANVLLEMRRGDEALARQTSANLASTIDADIGRNLELYDLSLRAVVDGMQTPEVMQTSKAVRQLILFDRAATAKHFGAIEVFDASGELTVDSSSLELRRKNAADQDYFKAHRDNPDTGLFISTPTLHQGAYAIVLSRRISNSDGSFGGVAVGSIRFSYFHNLFDRLTLAPDDSMTVIRRDGVIIMRNPFDLDVIGKDLSKSPGVKRVLVENNGFFIGSGAVDQVERLYVWQDNKQPLITIVGRSLNNIYGRWEHEATKIGALLAALALLVATVTVFLAREMSRRAAAEEKLAMLAVTDSLTGLKNRRYFDDAIEREWQRSLRQRTPLTLLMIDADNFKAYNDLFGHQAGDQVLVAIASSISDSVRRAGDCGARYGGEEFAMLLPGMAAEDAEKFAERIRVQVESLPSKGATITVSIGVASVIPAGTLSVADFIGAADAALYEAKAMGRNRTRVASLSSKLHLVA